MTYIAIHDSPEGKDRVVCASKDGNTSKTYDALAWLAQLVTHIPNKGEQMVRCYGHYSNKSRGLRKKTGMEDAVPGLIDVQVSPKEFRKNWGRLIQKIYQVDPLLCPKCQGAMNVIGFIEDDAVIKKILRHLGLWETRSHDPPNSGGQLPATHDSELIYDGTRPNPTL